ncbi:acyl-CoA carboxylase subunit epsilon [Streptomyces sp. NBC_01007]|nr:acyl-CoA carboxylase subunit epsilon [Streptomyces sp. NBC_01007]WRZ95683.1 acyl-CoA carboxylase subunit epsilon [Streptomyces sp. NBC_01007]
MNESDSGALALRIERGHASEEELAALTVVLLALRGGRAEERGAASVKASRWWRGAAAYSAPRSWQ